MAVHEAPVYVPGINKLFVGVLEQGFESDPPVYAPNGGLIYWGKFCISILERLVLDPTSNKTTTLLNNYFGFYFNGLDDLFVDSHGDIWFADPDYAWNGNRTDTTPQLHAQTYRFPSFPPVNSGWLKIHSVNPMVSPSPLMPENVYICDTIAGISGTISPHYPNIHSLPCNQTAKQTVYRYDIVDADTAPALINKRPFYYSQEWVPGGVNVAANGFVVAGMGM
ncbi:hypothetical protein D6C93_10464, partial [Aureobasidium pullulans]